MNTLVRNSLVIAVVLSLIMPAPPVSADYVEPKGVINVSSSNTLSNLLFNAASEGVKAGVQSVAEKLLNDAGKAVLNSYLPGLGDILFGGGANPIEQYTKQILERLDSLESDLAERDRQILKELQDQFGVDLSATVKTQAQSMNTWLAAPDLLVRVNSKDHPCEAKNQFNLVRNKIEEYIKKGSDVRNQFRRLNLLPVHITTAQLAVTASRYCEGINATLTAFQREHGSDYTQFDNWIYSLSSDDISRIEAMNPQFSAFKNIVYNDVLRFYDELSKNADNDIEKYTKAIFTPPVSPLARFRTPAQFDIPAVVTDPANWPVAQDGFVPILDGVRWYYYADIPKEECLKDYAYFALFDIGKLPITEKEGQPAASDCNRFWIVDPFLNITAWPNTYLGSFDGYSMWFDNPLQMYDVHKKLVYGDLVRQLYGSASLVLDRIYAEQNNGNTRPLNQWDEALKEYDHQVALLGVSDSLTKGLSYEDSLAAEGEIAKCGITIPSVGLSKWFELLKLYIDTKSTAPICPATTDMAKCGISISSVGLDKWFELLKLYIETRSTASICVANVAATSSASNARVSAGSIVTYSLTVTNKGPMVATDIALVNTLPSVMTFISGSSGCSQDPTGTVTCKISSLGFEKEALVTITAVANAARTPSGTHSVTNSVVANVAQPDPDLSNNSATGSISVLAYPGTLLTGWHLFSMPIAPADPTPAQILKASSTRSSILLSFEQGALTYEPSLPQFGTLKSVDGMHGYWTYAENDGFLAVTGRILPPNTPISLEKGWNLVSCLLPEPLLIADALTSIAGKYDRVLSYDTGALSYYSVIPSSRNTLKSMEQGKGYWIHMQEPGTLDYSLASASTVGSASLQIQNQPQQTESILSSNEWISVYSQNTTYNNLPLPVGAVVTAIGEDGRSLGQVTVNEKGTFGVLAVYGDSAYTKFLDGAKRGEHIQFLINGQLAKIVNGADPTWSSNGDLIQVDLAATGPEIHNQVVYLPMVRK